MKRKVVVERYDAWIRDTATDGGLFAADVYDTFEAIDLQVQIFISRFLRRRGKAGAARRILMREALR